MSIQGFHGDGLPCYSPTCGLVHVTPEEVQSMDRSETVRRLENLKTLAEGRPPIGSLHALAEQQGRELAGMREQARARYDTQPSPEQIARIAKAFADAGEAVQVLVAGFAPALAAFTAEMRRVGERLNAEATAVLADMKADKLRSACVDGTCTHMRAEDCYS